MNVRPATVNDIVDIINLLGNLRESPSKQSLVTSQLAAIVADPARVVLLLEDNQGIQAMAVINLVYKLPKIEARIDEVVVSETARGKGYGRAIIEACESWAWEHEADSIEFTSRPSRIAANSLYQKLGYDLRETNVYNRKRGM